VRGFDPRLVRDTYSAIAGEYAATFADDLERHAVNRELLGTLAHRVAGRGAVLDLGCGPGQVGGYLTDRGCQVVGIDPAEGMLSVASRRHPGLAFMAGDMLRLPLRAHSCAGAVAFCVLHHFPRSELRPVLAEVHRVLAPEGALLLATHGGSGEFGAKGIDDAEVTGTLYEPDELTAALTDESFAVDAVRHRDPLPHERQGDRIYVLATASG
jgi:SAM-dependent methyltransferase